MIVFDANVLIAHLNDSDRHHIRAQSLLEANNGESWGASSVTLAEVLVYPVHAGRLAEAEATLVGLDVQEVPLGSGASGRLAEMRVEVGLKMPDCCALLAAQNNEAALATFDARLISAAEKLGIAVVSGAPEPGT
ncbi:MAG TPA: type II toxin-antitoxin system VapC family toxin [Solirubrobacterales bacterium]|nr:type II toxin-antitoxin system VapC family toxin [Solirubrobacterales bacterium]